MNVEEFAKQKGLRWMGLTPEWPPSPALTANRLIDVKRREKMPQPGDLYASLSQAIINTMEQREVTWKQYAAEMEAGLRRAIEDFQALKTGELSLDNLVVSDNGYEFMPEAPSMNGKTDEKVPALVGDPKVEE